MDQQQFSHSHDATVTRFASVTFAYDFVTLMVYSHLWVDIVTKCVLLSSRNKDTTKVGW